MYVLGPEEVQCLTLSGGDSSISWRLSGSPGSNVAALPSVAVVYCEVGCGVHLIFHVHSISVLCKQVTLGHTFLSLTAPAIRF